MGYNEFCELESRKPWTHEWEPAQDGPYAHNDTQWISFENEHSIKLKCRFALNSGLGGIMVSGLEADDFQGVSDTSRFPLLNAINSVVRNPEWLKMQEDKASQNCIEFFEDEIESQDEKDEEKLTDIEVEDGWNIL